MRGPRLRLFLLSALMLFLELSLIRWLGANVLYLSFFSNFVLLGSFLGIGIGFLRASGLHLWRALPYLLLGLVAVVLVTPVAVDRSGSALIYVGRLTGGLPPFLVLPFIFLVVAAVMAGVGQAAGAAFRGFPALEAYRLDLLGSLTGILASSLLAFLEAPPVVWGVIVAALVLALDRRRALVRLVALLALVASLGHESLLTADVYWSPYYKLLVSDNSITDPRSGAAVTVDDIAANGVPTQDMTPVALLRAIGDTSYFAPYGFAAHRPRSVLVIGAGNGKDVAIALAEGAEHVDAVEIDPRIQQLGAQLNADRPYADPRVSVHIDDGRSFLQRSTDRWDMILLSQTDSITLVLGQSSLRLESYLFTREAVQTMREHLNPGGVVASYNYYWERWYVDRLANTLQSVFGSTPCLESTSQQGTVAALAVGLTPDAVRCPGREWQTATSPAPAPVADAAPFPYLQRPSIPPLYLATIGLILAASLVAVRLAGGGLRRLLPYADLFLMGAGFLLIETKNIVQLALLFGTTWLVNAIAFTGILLAAYAAVELSRLIGTRGRRVIGGLLLASLVAAALIPGDSLLALAFPVRLVAAIAVAFTPVLLANLLFAQRFRESARSTDAFAANLLGAMLGGVLEYLALLIGYESLLLVVAGLYALALLTTSALGRRAPAG
jgi:hypothetical protein